jgi:hypothetical protein
MPLSELIADANSIVGFGVLVVTTISGFGYWIHRRMKAVATEVSAAVVNSLNEMNTRVTTLETAKTEHAKKIESVEVVVAHLGNRMQTAETTIRALPTSKDFHELALSMMRIEGDIGKLDERLKPIGAIATRLQEFQLENGAQK